MHKAKLTFRAVVDNRTCPCPNIFLVNRLFLRSVQFLCFQIIYMSGDMSSDVFRDALARSISEKCCSPYHRPGAVGWYSEEDGGMSGRDTDHHHQVALLLSADSSSANNIPTEYHIVNSNAGRYTMHSFEGFILKLTYKVDAILHIWTWKLTWLEFLQDPACKLGHKLSVRYILGVYRNMSGKY